MGKNEMFRSSGAVYFPKKDQFSILCACGHFVTRFYQERPTDSEIAELRRKFENHNCPNVATPAEKTREREYIRTQLNLYSGR